MKEKGFPIIYINDHYDLWQADFDKIIDKCRNVGNASLIEGIKTSTGRIFSHQAKHSAFYGTALNTLLKRLNVDTLIITGIAGNICVLFTANDAYMREYKLWIPKDCIASASG